MSDTKGNAEDVLLSLVVGTAIGVGIGILIAPDKGSNTREKIKDKFTSSKEGVEDTVEGIMSFFRKKSNDVTSSIDDALEEAISGDGAKKEELISYLDEKLKTLKKAAK